MAITAMGLGTKGAPANTNLDPQNQFWSWLYAFKNAQHIGTTAYRNGLFAGFSTTQNSPAGMSVLVGANTTANSAVLEYAAGKMALLSTDGTPQVVTIPTAPTSGSRIDSIVSYIDVTNPEPDSETPGTPEYVKTVVVSGTAASSPTAPTKQQIQSALPPTVENWYHWADVRVGANQTTITNSNITDRKPTPPNLYSATILDLIYPVGSIAIGAKPSLGTWERIQGKFLWASNTAHPAGSTGGEETHKLTINEMPSHSHTISEGNGSPGSQWSLNAVQNSGRNTSMGTNKTGGGRAHNNMPPYLSVDMWRRTA